MTHIYYNGKVFTGDENLQQAFVVENKKFIYVGNNEEALKYKDENSKLIDLDEKFVCPGFNDSNMHVLGYGYSLKMINLSRKTSSLEEMKNAIKEYINSNKLRENEWICGRGWNHDYFNDVNRFPTKDDLDEISTEYPICIIRACGHVCVVNSKALELAGINKNTLQIEGGQFDIDENNEPNGIFRENALNLIYNKIPKPDKEDIKNMILKACESLNSYGVTSAQTDDFIVFPGVDYEVIINAYKELANEEKLTVKIYEQAQLAQKEELESFLSKGYTTGVGDDYFKIGPLKLLGDGSLGARTAYLNEPYSDDNSTFGICTYTQEQFDEMVEIAHKNNMQVAIHAIGDKAMDMVVNSIEKALDKYLRDNHRHGVVHCQLTTSDLLNRFRDLNLHAYVQSIFLDYDINIVEDRIGVDRAKTSYNFNTLFNETTMSNGSDCPVELPNVLNGIYCAVTRKTLDGKGPFLPNQALSVKDAILSFTRNGAYASFEEDIKGDIAVGKAADFVLLSDNLLDIDANKIKDVKVLNTFLDGKCVYSLS